MSSNRGMFDVIGNGLEQLTLSVGIVSSLCLDDERSKRLSRQLADLHDRIATEERMLRVRFELPAVHRQRTREAAELMAHRVAAPERPAEIHRQLRTGQEMCRSLEEYFRFFNLPNVSRFYHKLRLDLYAFERALVEIFGPPEPPSAEDTALPAVSDEPTENRVSLALRSHPLYFILDESLCRHRDPLRLAYDVVSAGVRMIQLRFKKLGTRELLDMARRIKRLTAEYNCLLIINDRADVALLSGADGVHVGALDLTVSEIRQLGSNLLVGATARTPQAAVAAQSSGADYIGCGAVFSSKTKQEVPVIGTTTLARIVKTVDIPVVGIGGITLENCCKAIDAGAAGFCSIRPFTSRRSVKNLVKDFKREGLAEPKWRR